MSIHLQRQIEKLKGMIRALSTAAEDAVDKAIMAVENRDAASAREVIEQDRKINEMEIDIEEECLHTLALHQPVAFDLRYVVAVLKINNELERIGDHAVGIAEQAVFLASEATIDSVPFNLTGMTVRVRQMLDQALEALINVDTNLAEFVRKSDDEVDAIHRQMYEQVEAAIRVHPEQVAQLVNLMNISRQLERIADLTVNIAEDVIYMARGDIARHHRI
ncbi:MAG: phosphate signaling complex protein PhoU [Planctomycetes bacterium]|nr:phosphate signaling complex protein PhoU [Planctomycetota bacterium]